jgi:acetyltransferase-like isoleucine patch superfamily enzyme
MVYRDLRATPAGEAAFEEFLETLSASLTNGSRDPNDVVRDTLCEIYFGQQFSAMDAAGLGNASRALVQSLDPRNITTEPEYYAEIDERRYAQRKPFIWLWQMFDRSPLGQNALLGHKFRRMLAPLIFNRVGVNFKCWNHVEWSYGYNLSFGDNVVIHRHVLLDDRGGIEIGSNVSISDYVNVYSHSHDIDNIEKVSNLQTRIGNHVRITYHATVLAGVAIGDHAMIGTGAVVTRDIEPYHIALGIPAKTVKVKTPAVSFLKG